VTTDQIPLRQRKQERARHAIQDAALDLFETQGFVNTTVEQIAAVAEVSPSTVYRYFKTKHEIVFWDRWDPVIVAAIKNRPLDEQPIDSLRAAMDDLGPRMVALEGNVTRRRAALIFGEPALRSHIGDQIDVTVDLIVRVFAERTKRDEHDLELRVVSYASMWALLVAYTTWLHDGGDLLALVQRAMSVLASGVRLPDFPA